MAGLPFFNSTALLWRQCKVLWGARVIRVDACRGWIRRYAADNVIELEDLESGLGLVSPKAIVRRIERGKIDGFIATNLRHYRLGKLKGFFGILRALTGIVT
jgi:hypothetical protein